MIRSSHAAFLAHAPCGLGVVFQHPARRDYSAGEKLLRWDRPDQRRTDPISGIPVQPQGKHDNVRCQL